MSNTTESTHSEKIIKLKPFTLDSYLTSYLGALSYRIDGKGETWIYDQAYSCRDSFQNLSYKRKNLLYNCGQCGGDAKVKSLIEDLETHLNLTDKTIIGPTNRPGYIWLKIPRWWSYNNLRRSFFTGALRAALVLNYSKQDLISRLLRYNYFNITAYATERFLNGYTKPTIKVPVSRRGWYDVFNYGDFIPVEYYESPRPPGSPVPDYVVDKCLVRP